MPRPRPLVPELYWLKSESQWCVDLPTRKRLGPDRALAEQRYRRLVAEWLARGEQPEREESYPLVAVALERYLAHMQAKKLSAKYLHRITIAIQAVCELYGSEPTSQFTQISLQAVRKALELRRTGRVAGGRAAVVTIELLSSGPMPFEDLNQSLAHLGLSRSAIDHARGKLGLVKYYDRTTRKWMAQLPDGLVLGEGKPLARSYINALIDSVQAAWEWLVSQQMAPDASAHALASVRSLREDEGGRETAPRMPVPPEVVEATLKECGRVVTAMVRIQGLTGARPGEVCRMRAAEISRSPDQPVRVPIGEGRYVEIAAVKIGDATIWAYAPQAHKTRKKGKPRVIPLGAEAQAVLAPYLDRPADVPFFSVREAVDEWRDQRGQRKKYGRGRVPGEQYTSDTYASAIERAARRAGVPHWSPYALRHAVATVAANEADQSVAQALLGHATPDMTAHYIHSQFAKAAKFIAEQEGKG